MINTTDSKLIRNALHAVKLWETVHDCPEYCLHGIKEAIKYALPNSIAFVFTDASARDYAVQDELLNLLQEKQITVNFFLTGEGCNGKNDPAFLTYYTIARSTNGIVSTMRVADIKNALEAMINKIDPYYEIVDKQVLPAGMQSVSIEVGLSTKVLEVTASGMSPKITIVQPNNEKVVGKPIGSDIVIATIQQPPIGKYESIVESSGSSQKTLEVAVVSEIIFDYSFNLDRPSSKSQRTYQPVEGRLTNFNF